MKELEEVGYIAYISMRLQPHNALVSNSYSHHLPSMLALRASRTSLTTVARARQIPATVSRLSTATETSELLDFVGGVQYQTPPTAGPDGYAIEGPNSQSPNVNLFRFNDQPSILEEKQRYRLHCHAGNNNTITTFTGPDGKTLASYSGGQCGFKGVNRSGYEAGYQCAIRIFKDIAKEQEKRGDFDIQLFFKGFGSGREALAKAIMAAEGEQVRASVVSVTDRTPIKIGGTRAKKARRL